MVGVNKFLQMDLAIKGDGSMICLMGEEFLFKLMEADTKESLRIKYAMGLVGMYLEIKKLYMKDSFKMMYKMDLEFKSKLISINILAALKIKKKMVLVLWYGMMEKHMRDFGRKDNLMVMEDWKLKIHVFKEILNKENLICLADAYGKMEVFMKENIIWEKRKDMENIYLLMVGFIKETGKMENSTGKVN